MLFAAHNIARQSRKKRRGKATPLGIITEASEARDSLGLDRAGECSLQATGLGAPAGECVCVYTCAGCTLCVVLVHVMQMILTSIVEPCRTSL